MIPQGSNQSAHSQEPGGSTGRSLSPPSDSLDTEMLQWCEDIMMHPEGGWPDKPAPGTTPIRENEYDNGGSSIPGPSHAHHTPADTLTSDEIMAMIMSFSDAAPSATSAPHLHTLEAGNDVHARLSTVRFDSPPPLRQVDSPPPSRSRYTPYKIIDRVAIHRGRHHLGDDVEQRDAGPSVPVPDTVPPPAVSLATTSEALPPTRAWFGLETIPEVKQKAREDMRRSMFDDSFLISSKERSAKALASIADIVTTFNNRKSPIECILTRN
jgi:hypothetical protein